MKVFELTATQANAVRKALKLLRLQYWKFTIEPHPMKKSLMRVVFNIRGRPSFEESGREWNQINQILGAKSNVRH